MKKYLTLGLFGLFSAVSIANAATPLMSADWGKTACDAWNASGTLTSGLAGDTWAANDGGKGHKIMHVYRMDCNDSATAELRIANKDGKAMCIYGGAVESKDLNKKFDYVMFAKTKNWERMGTGKDGPMKAMGLGRLKFEGPKMEAMSNMGPFGAFLKLTGEIPGDTAACPK